jgi:hypothetical protein
MRMKREALLFALLAIAGTAQAHDYPTVDRVEFVVECMRNNGGEYHYLYKCACVIDTIAKELTYDQYVEDSTVARYQGMAGERMGEFRDPDAMKDSAKRYRSILANAKKQCSVPK